MPRKLALIIGNNDYQKDPLQTCVNDASSLAKVLRDVGCEVDLRINLKSDEMAKCIQAFAKTIQQDDFVIFFFVGHGLQWEGQNFLMPCNNQKIVSNSDMQRYAINAQRSLDQISNMKPHFILFLLDCCREYWLTKTSDSQVDQSDHMIARLGTLISFACSPGQTTSDQVSDTTNGLFTKSLLKHIITPGVDIQLILRRVANDVVKETNHKQMPYQISSLITEDAICLVPAVANEKHSHVRLKDNIPSISIKQSLNIVFIGEKGVGKSTFINAFVNYLSFKTLREAQDADVIALKPLSFPLNTESPSERRIITLGNIKDSDSVNIPQCQTYTFDPHLNDTKTLQIIDTPSLEDTPQPNQNNNATIQHILDYINQLSHINAVCFLLQPDASRLSTTFQTCFTQLINRFGRNIYDNIIFCFPNALSTFFTPGSTTSLIRKMFASHSLNDIPFTRNNSFFFENESFLYLVAATNGMEFDSKYQEEYTPSWPSSVKESNRLLDYVRQRPIYEISKEKRSV